MDHEARWGQFFTPAPVARFMASLVDVENGSGPFRILDPGAGTGVLGVAAATAVLEQTDRPVHLVAVEAEPSVQPTLRETLRQLAGSDRVTCEVHDRDFLEREPLGSAFDLAIANPPYFKISPSDPRGGDAPNVYARFMEVALDLLRPGGQLVVIVPRSFAAGLYFRRFRKRFHERASLRRAHVFESRRAVFEGVLQESVVVRYVKSGVRPDHVVISSSHGAADLDHASILEVAIRHVLSPDDPRGVLSLPTTPEDLDVLEQVRSWPETLESLDMQISTGPVVPFRANGELVSQPTDDPVVPLVWMDHVRGDRVTWPLPGFGKAQHIRADSPRLIPRGNYVLLRRFSTREQRRRLTVAPVLEETFDSELLGFENHLNYIHRPGGQLTRSEVLGLTALLSSPVLDRFFRISSGNTQVSATEIRALPLPSRDVIERLAIEASAVSLPPAPPSDGRTR